MSEPKALVTPIHIKAGDDMPWPSDQPVFYTLAANGLFVCRNHEFFRSCAPAPDWPSELAEQEAFLQLRYPKVPRRLFELIVGFFDRIGTEHGAEAAVLLAWDRIKKRIHPIVPPQRATVSRSWRGNCYPIGLHYEVPPLPAGWVLIGDVHSHVDDPAYASGTDERDEKYRAGLHIVVGRISREPPDLHVAAVVDRARFKVAPDLVIEDYQKRCTRVPRSWIEKVSVEVYGYSSSSSGWGSSSYDNGWGKPSKKNDDYYGYPIRRDDPPRDDRKGDDKA
jgi:proteasome lid subunit RPN8/RPN11